MTKCHGWPLQVPGCAFSLRGQNCQGRRCLLDTLGEAEASPGSPCWVCDPWERCARELPSAQPGQRGQRVRAVLCTSCSNLKPWKCVFLLLVPLWGGCRLCSSAPLCFGRAALILFHFFLWICTCCAPKAHWPMVSSEGSPPPFHRHFFKCLPHSRSFLLRKGN